MNCFIWRQLIGQKFSIFFFVSKSLTFFSHFSFVLKDVPVLLHDFSFLKIKLQLFKGINTYTQDMQGFTALTYIPKYQVLWFSCILDLKLTIPLRVSLFEFQSQITRILTEKKSVIFQCQQEPVKSGAPLCCEMRITPSSAIKVKDDR